MIDLNADLGEGAGTDSQLLPVITSANIACGGHAGDSESMRAALGLARACGVGIGAHPSFPDREGFGRRAMRLPPAQITEVVVAQILALLAEARAAGASLQHVKPHGALYNLAVADVHLATAIGEAVRRVDPKLIVVALAGSGMAGVFKQMGLRVAREAFVDRGYTPEGTLVPRDRPGALITDAQEVAARALRMARHRVVTAIDGTEVEVVADTLCLHSDTPNAVALATAARHALEGAGITVARMGTFL